MNNTITQERENNYKIKVVELLNQLSKVKNIINFKRVVVYETEIEKFAKEMEMSYESSKKVINSVYADDLLTDIYNDTYLLIEEISQKILNDYKAEDYFFLSPKDYFLIFQKTYN